MSLPIVRAFRRIVTSPRSDRVTGITRDDLYLAELSISCSIRGVVAKAVLASQFLRDLIEDFSEGVFVTDGEGAASGFRGELSKGPDVSSAVSAIASAPERERIPNAVGDSVDNGVALMR